MSQKLIGKVEWFDSKKGFGVIKYEDKEYFAHHSEIKIKHIVIIPRNIDINITILISLSRPNQHCAAKA